MSHLEVITQLRFKVDRKVVFALQPLVKVELEGCQDTGNRRCYDRDVDAYVQPALVELLPGKPNPKRSTAKGR
jgi:hypothetical protein